MTEIEKMKRYIARTPVNNDRCYMGSDEACAILSQVDSMVDVLEALALAFSYGRAKGYRAAKAEVRR